MKKNSQTTAPYCSIITVSYKSQNDVEQLIKSLFEYSDNDGQYEIIVVSNSGDCVDLSMNENVTVVQSDGNVGFARGCNNGARVAKGKYLLFCNPDVRISIKEINTLCQTLDQSTSIGMVSPAFSAEMVNFSNPLMIEDNRVIGACLCLSHKIFSDLGGWDENFFLWGEDRDLGTRVRNSGLKVAVHRGVLAKHFSGHSWKNSDAQKNQYLSKVWICSQVYYNLKHRGLTSAYKYLFSDIFKNTIRLIMGFDTFGRINDTSTSVSFSIRLLFTLNLRRQVIFDGKRYAWEKQTAAKTHDR